MAVLRKTLAQRFSQVAKLVSSTSHSAGGAAHLRGLIPPSAPDEPGPLRRFLLSPFLQKRPPFRPALPPDRLALTVGVPLVERIRGLIPDRIRLDMLLPPPGSDPAEAGKEEAEKDEAVPIAEARKAVMASQMDAARARLRATGESCIARSEFVRICCETSGSERGAEVARSLDESGAVIVWGDVVFLRPEEVAKAIEKAMPLPLTDWKNAEREELRSMEEMKAEIDRTAAAQVRRELWCGLGLLVAQTAAFMRVTFWELSWDVMEPICFYVTSIYFMAGYAFFLRTSREPSFEGFFESRFAARQRRLMKARNFDVEHFNELRRACAHPPSPPHREHAPPSCCHCTGRAH